MHITDFDYDLPEELIAQEPATRRDQSRLLVLQRQTGERSHHVFSELPNFLSPGDLLVLNDTRVVAARLVGRRKSTGGKWEGLYVRLHPENLWELLLSTRGHLQPGEWLLVDPPGGGAVVELELIEKIPPGRWLVRPSDGGAETSLGSRLERMGQVPIPPYIRKGHAESRDQERYQTIFARAEGAVAAPTAGLHFTPELFATLEQKGIERAFVTLHVGPGTFQPVKVDDVRAHRVEPEWGEISEATARAINACKQRGGRVIAVGTTTTRVLESAGAASDTLSAWSGLTDLTIIPPYTFRIVDALITNFHLPRSSLLLLVAAFTDMETLRATYADAIERRYRFYSYGDALLIL